MYLATAADVEAEVTDLLSDSHTGMLGTPSAGGIYWEQGADAAAATLLAGEAALRAERRRSKWIGSTSAKKTDARGSACTPL